MQTQATIDRHSAFTRARRALQKPLVALPEVPTPNAAASLDALAFEIIVGMRTAFAAQAQVARAIKQSTGI